MLSPPPSTCQSPSSNMYSTCRALQSLLANNLPTLSSSPKTIRAPPPHLGSPIVLTTTAGPRAAQPKKTKSHNTVQANKITKSHPRTPPRSNLKRRRSSSSSSVNNEEAHTNDPETLAHSIPSTPKRQRTCPPTLPLGLDRKDFDALSSNPVASTPPHTPAPHTPDLQKEKNKETETETETEKEKVTEEQEEPTWSTTDDSALVSLILSKLRLRQSDWDDCARELGKERGSIGRRWAYLLGDGEVGLRRGRGRGEGGLRRGGGEGVLRRGRGNMVRGEVEKMVFGPPLRLVREEE